jgi:DNA repair protein RadD
MSRIDLRPYQQGAVDSVMEYWRAGGGNPLVDMATGLGKSVVIATMIKDLLRAYPDMRVLVLVHVRELVSQDFTALLRIWPDAPAGIYSAGLGRRDAHQRITFASIQSVYKKAAALGPRDLVLIDEAHLVPNGGEGMYQRLLTDLREMRPDLRVCGFSATPYRLDSGRLDDGEGRLFDKVVYSYGVGAGIDDGWLSPLISKRGATEIDVMGVARRGGEFIPGALEAAADNDALTQAAVAEMLTFGQSRRSWLVFCAGVKHAGHVADALNAAGISAACITGDTESGTRDHLIREFKAGRLRALTNANVLTVGFDSPSIDMIVMLRPTLSTGLFVQMVGRGTRLADGKADCLVLDFAGNCRRHGPVDQIEVETKRKKLAKEDMQVKPETVRAKECPVCESMAGLAARVCKTCGHEWPPVVEHDAEADDAPILSREAPKIEPNDQPVLSWTARAHEKFAAPPSLCVEYLAGLLTVREWLAFEHGGYPRHKAGEWWSRHGGASPTPTTVADAIVRFGELTKPSHIITRKNGKWHDIVGRRFDAGQQEQAA